MTKTQRLDLAIRDDGSNLFARLCPSVAQGLHADACHELEKASIDSKADVWKVQKSSMEFLPLEISFQGTTIFTSYNGGSKSELGSIEMPRTLFSESINPPSVVLIKALSWIPKCTRLEVDPLTVADWELLEAHADALEQGGLLQQVSVVYPGQSISLQIGRDVARVVVKGVNEDTSAAGDNVWPEDPQSRSQSTYTRCVLLVQDTEVVIAPKTRPRRVDDEVGPPLRLSPCDLDFGTAMRDLASVQKIKILTVPPRCVLIHGTTPATDNQSWAWASSSNDDSKDQCVALVRVIHTPELPPKHAVLHALVRLELGLAVYYDSIQLQPVRILEIQNIGLDELQLESVHVEDNWRQAPAWCRPRDYFEEDVELPVPPFDLEDDVAVLSLGAVVPRSWMEGDYQGPIELYRIVSVNPPEAELSLRKLSATLSREDLASLWHRFCEVGNGGSISLPCPERDYFTNIVPTLLLAQDVSESSSKWIEEAVKGVGRRGGGTLTCLCGPTGIGRTHSAFMVAALSRLRFQQATLYLDCKRLQESSMRMMEILAQLQTLFEQAVKGRPAMIILDEFDRLAPNLLSGDESDTAARSHPTNPVALDQSKLITDRLLHLIEAASCKQTGEDFGNISVLITCPSAESVHPAILESRTLSSNVVAIPSMGSEERAALLGKMIGVIGLDPDFVGPMTEGYRPRDLEKVASRARQMLRSDSSKAVDEVVSASLKGFVPLSQMSLARSQKASGLSWSELGGLFRVKEKLASTILHPAKYRLIYEKASVRLPRGVLLFGPPGCGKSALVPALARECNFPLITCKGPEVLDKYIGASEAKVRELFARASAVAPSILFLDELDALAPRRGSDHTGVTDRVVNQLLTFLDGVEDASSATVYVLAATSRPDKVDPALLRPGRLEQHLFVGPPESDEEWSDTLSKIALNWNMQEQDRHFISSNDLVHEISKSMPHARRFAAADLKAVMDTAHVSAVHEALTTKTVDEIKEVTVQMLHLKESLLKTRACLSPDDAQELKEIYRPFLRDADIAATVGGDEANGSPAVRKLRTALR